MATNAFATYRENQLLTASPVKLIHLAYEGAVESISQARVYVQQKQIQERCDAITKAQLILQELQNGLDYARGGELSRQLADLYNYMQARLNEANFKQTEEPLAEVQGLLETLAGAWADIATQDLAVAVAAAPASTPVIAGGYNWAGSTDNAPTYSFAGLTL